MSPAEAILETVSDLHPELTPENATAEVCLILEGLWDRGVVLASARRTVASLALQVATLVGLAFAVTGSIIGPK